MFQVALLSGIIMALEVEAAKTALPIVAKIALMFFFPIFLLFFVPLWKSSRDFIVGGPIWFHFLLLFFLGIHAYWNYIGNQSLGVFFLEAGAFSNLLVVIVNDKMPVVIKNASIKFQEKIRESSSHKNSQNCHLLFLADRFFIPPFPLELSTTLLGIKKESLKSIADFLDLGDKSESLVKRFGLEGAIASIGDLLMVMGIWGNFIEMI